MLWELLNFLVKADLLLQAAIDTTAAGDLWDNTLINTTAADATHTAATAVTNSDPGDNSFFYTLPSMVDGLSVSASYSPQQATASASAMGFGVGYTGVEGLSVHYAVTDIETDLSNTSGDQTVMKATYAYGPVTVGYSVTEMDLGATDLSGDQETTSMAISYTCNARYFSYLWN